MRNRLVMALVTAPCLGCGAPRLELTEDPLRVTVRQRQADVIPGSGDRLVLKVDDVTAGQVLVSIDDRYDGAVVRTRSVRRGDVTEFRVGDRTYYLSVVELRNFLAGEDFGVFEISSRPPGAARTGASR